jgi:hypothetical protein
VQAARLGTQSCRGFRERWRELENQLWLTHSCRHRAALKTGINGASSCIAFGTGESFNGRTGQRLKAQLKPRRPLIDLCEASGLAVYRARGLGLRVRAIRAERNNLFGSHRHSERRANLNSGLSRSLARSLSRSRSLSLALSLARAPSLTHTHHSRHGVDAAIALDGCSRRACWNGPSPQGRGGR